MIRSLMTAVTGVRAHQTMLDVTGNNIANVNTVGFKKDYTIFSDLMYQTQKSASGAGDELGGIDPAQVGLGVNVTAIETIFTQGSASYTGSASDMMIQGSGFFVYKSGTSEVYSRSGATVRDENSDLVLSGSGYYLQGYEITEDPLNTGEYVRSSELSNINVPVGKKIEPRATTEVQYQCNLDSRTDAYLPYGFMDLPLNAYTGWTGNDSGTAKVSIDGFDCDIRYKSLSDLPSGNSAGDDGSNYLEIYIDDGIEAGDKQKSIIFDMRDIDSGTGRPSLSCRTEFINVGSASEGGDMPQLSVVYDDDTGTLKLFNEDSEVVFETNLAERMNYKSFVLTDRSTNPSTTYPVIAEFDESVVNREFSGGNASDMSKTLTTLTMWYPNPEADGEEGGGVVKMTAQVYLNPDGTFTVPALPENTDANGDLYIPIEGTLPGAFNENQGIRLKVSDDGTYLDFQQALDPANPVKFESVAQINIGGYHSVKKTIYDDNGNEHTLEVNFKKLTTNRWRWEAYIVETDSDGNESYSNIIPDPHAGEIEFNGAGLIQNAVTSDNTRHGNNDESNARVEIDIPFSLNGQSNSTVTLNFGGSGEALMGITQFASTTTTKAIYQDGYTMGILEKFSIGVDGTVTGTYSNGKNIPMYRVALAMFANEQGLEKIGDSLFSASVNSGVANIDPANSNGKGSIMSQNLEMSNVDLTEEFTHLIIAQRGFQANARTITTSDQVLEEVVNLKR